MSDRRLIMTTTGEPYQPVRLTYSIPGRGYAVQRLRRLRCVEDDPKTRTMTIWLDDEARALELDTPEPHVEAFGQRVILGTIRFPKKKMVVQVRSVRRAIEIAKMLRPVLGERAGLVRVRIVNRLFAAEELTGELDELDQALDQNVTVVRWQDREREQEEALAGATTPEELERAYARYQEQRRRRPVPLVEDFPHHPEDETEAMTDLTGKLSVRFMCALRRWNGEDVTIVQVIEEMVAQHESALTS